MAEGAWGEGREEGENGGAVEGGDVEGGTVEVVGEEGENGVGVLGEEVEAVWVGEGMEGGVRATQICPTCTMLMPQMRWLTCTSNRFLEIVRGWKMPRIRSWPHTADHTLQQSGRSGSAE